MSGLFITFEGIEGCGKSTQLAQCAAALRLRGADVVTTREPGGTLVGDAIRAVLLDPQHRDMTPTTECLLYAASRAQHVEQLIAPALARGTIVLCDRFADATTAYQGAARGLSDTLITDVHRIATRGVWPQCTLVIDVPVAVGLARAKSRGAADRIEQETRNFHDRVRTAYLAIAAAEPERVHVIDGSGSPEDVHQRVMAIVLQQL